MACMLPSCSSDSPAWHGLHNADYGLCSVPRSRVLLEAKRDEAKLCSSEQSEISVIRSQVLHRQMQLLGSKNESLTPRNLVLRWAWLVMGDSGLPFWVLGLTISLRLMGTVWCSHKPRPKNLGNNEGSRFHRSLATNGGE